MNFNKIMSHPQMPNLITIGRLAAIPVIVIILALHPDPGPLLSAIVAVIFLVAALTDLLDGHLARKYNLVSNLGKFLDPLADKLLTGAAFIMLIPSGRVPAWVAFLIIAREMAVTGLRAIAVEKGLVIAASNSGKQKTLAQNIALFCLLWHHSFLGLRADLVGTVILYVALAATYWSGGLYFYDFFKASRLKDSENSPV